MYLNRLERGVPTEQKNKNKKNKTKQKELFIDSKLVHMKTTTTSACILLIYVAVLDGSELLVLCYFVSAQKYMISVSI